MMLNAITGRNQPRNAQFASLSLELDGDGGFDVLLRPVKHPWCQRRAGYPAPAERRRAGPGCQGHPSPCPNQGAPRSSAHWCHPPRR